MGFFANQRDQAMRARQQRLRDLTAQQPPHAEPKAPVPGATSGAAAPAQTPGVVPVTQPGHPAPSLSSPSVHQGDALVRPSGGAFHGRGGSVATALPSNPPVSEGARITAGGRPLDGRSAVSMTHRAPVPHDGAVVSVSRQPLASIQPDAAPSVRVSSPVTPSAHSGPVSTSAQVPVAPSLAGAPDPLAGRKILKRGGTKDGSYAVSVRPLAAAATEAPEAPSSEDVAPSTGAPVAAQGACDDVGEAVAE